MESTNSRKKSQFGCITMIEAVTLDLDGTVYLGAKPVDGAADFIRFLRDRDIKLLFVTNRANRLPETILTQLNDMGIDCNVDDILTSSQATADSLTPSPVYIIGEIGLEQALLEKGYTITEENPEYVIVSFDRSFNYDKMKVACNLIHKGAKFIATNPDQALAMDTGILPGTGSIVAAIEAGCGVPPTVIGKPEPMILEVAAKRMGVSPSNTLAIGDNITTDIPSGQAAGMKTAIILTGISKPPDIEKASIKPNHTARDYAELTDIVTSLI